MDPRHRPQAGKECKRIGHSSDHEREDDQSVISAEELDVTMSKYLCYDCGAKRQ